ncbi:hypothetical protein HYW46_06775 [Candidatus Daviesbacteria bacterium]|nr:hypothetical protein [Candidatus Daviesbacteria bacterium]
MATETSPEIRQTKRYLPRAGRRNFLKLLGGVSLASLVAACAPQPVAQIASVPVESKPIINPPAKPEIRLQNMETPENRAKEWFNSVSTGNKDLYKAQFPANDPPLPLPEGLRNRYTECDINSNSTKILPPINLSDGTTKLVVDFNKNCIKNGAGVGEYRYIIFKMKKDQNGHITVISANPDITPN